MKRIYAHDSNETLVIEGIAPHGAEDLRDVVTAETRKHEQRAIDVQATPNLARLPHQDFAGRTWRQIVKNRISFRHDTRWGPPSHTLTRAIY